MNKMDLSRENLETLTGTTLEERAKLVLLTLGRTPDEIHNAFRKMAQAHHPDKPGGDTKKFQLINEAHELLTKGVIHKNSLLADDDLVIGFSGKKIEPLINYQKEWDKYEKWSREKFYNVGVV